MIAASSPTVLPVMAKLASGTQKMDSTLEKSILVPRTVASTTKTIDLTVGSEVSMPEKIVSGFEKKVSGFETRGLWDCSLHHAREHRDAVRAGDLDSNRQE